MQQLVHDLIQGSVVHAHVVEPCLRHPGLLMGALGQVRIHAFHEGVFWYISKLLQQLSSLGMTGDVTFSLLYQVSRYF